MKTVISVLIVLVIYCWALSIRWVVDVQHDQARSIRTLVAEVKELKKGQWLLNQSYINLSKKLPVEKKNHNFDPWIDKLNKIKPKGATELSVITK